MNFGTLALLVTAGLIGPALASAGRYAPPAVVGEIAAGLAIGHTGLGWINPGDPTLKLLSDVGFAMLMFIVGTHLPVRDPQLRSALGRGALTALTAGAGALVAGLLLAPHIGLDRPLVLTVLIATSSGAIALPVLQGLARTDRHTVVATAWIAVADVTTVLALPLVIGNGSMARILGGGTLVVVAAAGVYGAMRVLSGRRLVLALRADSKARGWALDLRVALGVLFALAWIATRFGTSILLAGFAAGAVVTLVGEPRRVAQELLGLGEGFFVPLFFVDLGARLDVTALVHEPRTLLLGAALLAAATLVHVGAALVWRLPPATGLLATAQLGVPSAVVSIGLQTHEVTAAQAAAIMGAVLGSLIVCAVGANVLGHRLPLTDHSAPA